MRQIFAVSLVALTLTGCDYFVSSSGRYSLFETSAGVVYRLDTISGATEIVFSTQGTPVLKQNGLYVGEGETHYVYLGQGKLKQLTRQELVDQLVKKYTGKDEPSGVR